MRRFVLLASLVLPPVLALACGGGEDDVSAPKGSSGASGASGSSGSAGVAGKAACSPDDCFERGSDKGHADPAGAKAAGQARAARIADPTLLKQPTDRRQRVNLGDFILINDKIAATIEDKGLSDGYSRFGGELLTIDRVGDDGRPLGLSLYGETLTALSTEMIEPTSVTVLHDGGDGKEAVVRVQGVLKPIPFLGSLQALFPDKFGVPAALDFSLAPGAESVRLRLHVVNTTDEDLDATGLEMHGFFQAARSRLYTDEFGFAKPKGKVKWVGFDNGSMSFAWRSLEGPLEYSLEISGFQYFLGAGFPIPKGETRSVDYAEIIPGGADLDALRAAIRRVDGEAPEAAVTGKVLDAMGAALAGAWVHAVDGAGRELSRTKSGQDGAYTLHVPPGDVRLVPSQLGYPTHPGAAVTSSPLDLVFAPHATLVVNARDAATKAPIPVRVQVIPAVAPVEPPASRGEEIPAKGRLHQEFAVTGDASLPATPGEARVIVSRGYEWELFDQTVQLVAGETKTLGVELTHSVDSTGVMCADFHIHSFFSADSDDPVVRKVKGAVADGLDIPVSSEHEWIIDFQPIISELGLQKWAFGMPSEELTTFTWGHFGVLPLRPKPDRVNQGAVDWIGNSPGKVFAMAHAEEDKPIVIVNHPSGSGFGAYFSAAKFDNATGKGDPAMWSDDFEAVEVFNDSDLESNRKGSLADWFSLLERGRKVWAVGSSDSHHIDTSPVGYPRTCIAFGHDDPQQLTPEAVRDGVAAGKATISGGLYMTVKGPGGAAPGATVAASGPLTLDVVVQSAPWISAESLEVFVDGKTVETKPLTQVADAVPGAPKVAATTVTVNKDPSRPRSWVVLHAKGKGDLSPLHPGRKPFAVSNPIFLE